jgi:hypothetical protein
VSSALFLKRLLLGGLLLLLLLPALQAKYKWVTVAPLKGYFTPPSAPSLTWESLRDSNYQDQLESYLQDRLGFRGWLLRLRNQLTYSLFQQTRVGTVMVGQDDVLYQPLTIQVYLGYGAGNDSAEIAYRVRCLKLVQDSLRAHGTQFLLVVAPGKARVLHRQFPAVYAHEKPGPSNYDAVVRAARQRGVNLLDAAALLIRWQDTARYPMFPRGGTHWSGYATSLVADTLFRRVEHLTKLDLPDFVAHGRTVATSVDSLRFTDNDIQDLLNLVRDVPPYPMAYPRITFGPEAGKRRVNALVIGDSFAQSFYGFYPYYQHLFTPTARYWSNNEQVYWPEDAPESHTVSELNFGQQLAGRDVVMIICTEQNLSKLGFGFIDKAYRFFRPLTPADEAAIHQLTVNFEKEITWEEASADLDLAKRHAYERAVTTYERSHL